MYTISKQGKRLLLTLIHKLEKLPRNRFNYSSWVGANYKGKPDLSCGTTACALGWATTLPSWRKLGLHLLNSVPHIEGGGGKYGSSAAAKLLGVRQEVASTMFIPGMSLVMGYNFVKSPPQDAGALEVARHLRNVLSNLTVK